jgi:hypothetical protein
MSEPDRVLADGQYQLVSMSPTAESGTSIELPGYEKVYAAFSHLDTDVQIQMLERYRLPVPRVIHCRRSDPRKAGRLDIDTVMAEDKARMQRAIQQSNVTQHLCDAIDKDPDNSRLAHWGVEALIRITNIGGDGYEQIVNAAVSSFEVHSNAQKVHMLESLTIAMNRRGNNVKGTEWQSDKSVSDALKIADDQRLDIHAERLNVAPGDMEPDVASAILQAGKANQETLANARMTLLKKVELPGVEERITFEFLREVVIKGKKRLIRQVTLDKAIDYPEIAVSRDAQSCIGKNINIWKQATNLIDQANFMRGLVAIVGRPQDGETHTNDSPICIAAYEYAKANPEAYKRFSGKTLRQLCTQLKDEVGNVIREAYTAGMFYRECFRAIGYKTECVKYASVKGKRIREYAFVLGCEFRQTVSEGLNNKYAEIIGKSQQTSVTGEPCSSGCNNVVTNKKTARLDSFVDKVKEKCIGVYTNIAEVLIDYGQHSEKITFNLA